MLLHASLRPSTAETSPSQGTAEVLPQLTGNTDTLSELFIIDTPIFPFPWMTGGGFRAQVQ